MRHRVQTATYLRLQGLALAGLLCFTAFAILPARAETDFLRWYPYDQALELGLLHGRPVLLYFRSDHCPYCEQMETFVLSAPEVEGLLERCTVVASITLGRSATAALGREWRVFGTPTFVFIRYRNGRWTEARRVFGSLPRKRFIEFLSSVCKEEG